MHTLPLLTRATGDDVTYVMTPRTGARADPLHPFGETDPLARMRTRAVADVLQAALALRDRHGAGTVSAHGLAIATGRLLTQLVRLLDAPRRHPALRRLARHLDTELTALFTFLVVPGTDATTWRAEQAIRPAVILRKVCGGNRSPRGARTHEVLASVLQTAHQRRIDPHPLLIHLLGVPAPVPAPALLTPRPLVQ